MGKTLTMTSNGQNAIKQAIATMSIENMSPSKLAYEKACEVMINKKTIEEAINEIKEMYHIPKEVYHHA